ncbi:MAG: PQQ-binding-like beta-propeller repeat protein [Treponema sp.]|nr:PQQ-binding-like beta-propeller repeat protein [Treponema sp.]
MKEKKFFILITILMILLQSLYSQEELVNLNSSWSTVMPGKVICEPAFTSYGFIIITDARNLMAYSNDGKLLWEKKLSKTILPSISVLPHDFILVSTNSNKTLTLLNPTGSTIWTKDFNSEIQGKAKAGRDGRIFVRSDSDIFCFGITGQQKWKLELPKMNKIPLQEFEDGTLLVFLNETKNGKSKGIRISPFGEKLEELTFTGEVTSALSCDKGILLTFKDSSCTLLNIVNDQTEKKWVLKKEDTQSKINYDYFILTKDKNTVIYLNHWSNKIEIDFIKLDKGEIEKSFFTSNLKHAVESCCSQNGIFITDGKKAYFYSFSGIEIWSGKLPSSKSREAWNYCIYSQNDYFIIFTRNWNINAFRTAQSSSAKSKTEDKKDYSNLYTLNTAIYSTYYSTELNKNLASEERVNNIKKGNYGKKEKEWSSELLSACYALQSSLSTTNFGARVEKSGFETDTTGVQLMLKQLSLWGTDAYCNFIAYFIKAENNNSLIHTLLEGLQDNPYDPDGLILNTLEEIAEKSNTKNEIILEDICDAVYKICFFMGRPAFNTKGKAILTSLMYPKYSSKTRLYARETLKKVSALDL